MEAIAKLPVEIRERLIPLVSAFREDQIPSLRIALKEYGDSIPLAAKNAAFMDVPMALRIRETALEIFNHYGELDSESRKLASAAVKYFLLREDAVNGFKAPGGFDDDALVMDTVAAVLGFRPSRSENPA